MNHSAPYTEVLKSLQGGVLQLKAIVFREPSNMALQVDIWGRVGNENPIYPPRDPDKSIAKHGGVEGYKKSPARGLFHHITIGQYLAFRMRAENHFLAPC